MNEKVAVTLPDLLARLEDIAEPAPVSYLPQTAAWAVLAVLLGVVALVVAVRGIRRWRSNRYRRDALAELAEIEARLTGGETSKSRAAAASVAVLLRRLALSIAPREQVASLAGESWLRFLDARVQGEPFTTGVGRRLLDVAYVPADELGLEEGERSELFALARSWIRHHRA